MRSGYKNFASSKRKETVMPSKEYYRKLKKEAHDLYVNDGLTCREISERVNVSEKSVSAWINANDRLLSLIHI